MKQKNRSTNSKDRVVEFSQLEELTEKAIKRNENSLRNSWDTIKWANVHIIGIPEEDREKDRKLTQGNNG